MTTQALIALVAALTLAGMALILFEILTPSLGLLGTMAATALGGAVYFAFQIHGVVGWVVLVALIVLTPIYISLLVKWLPHTALGRKLFLSKAPDGTGQAAPEAARHAALVGKEGVAETILRPSGAVRVEQQRVVALSESGIIQKGEPVTVVKVSGSNVVVRRSAERN